MTHASYPVIVSTAGARFFREHCEILWIALPRTFKIRCIHTLHLHLPWQRSFMEENTRFPFLLLFQSRVNPGKRGGSRVSALFYERVKSREKNVAKCTFSGREKRKEESSRAESNGSSVWKCNFCTSWKAEGTDGMRVGLRIMTWHNFMEMHTARSADTTHAMQSWRGQECDRGDCIPQWRLRDRNGTRMLKSHDEFDDAANERFN